MMHLLACWLHGCVSANHDWQIIQAMLLTLLKDIFYQPQKPHQKESCENPVCCNPLRIFPSDARTKMFVVLLDVNIDF